MPHSATAPKVTPSISNDPKKKKGRSLSAGSLTSNSGSVDSSNVTSKELAEKNPHIVIDTLMARRDSIQSTVIMLRRNKDEQVNIVVMVFVLLQVVLNFYFSVSYSSESGCEKGVYTVDANVFCALAGLMSLPFLILSATMWKRGRNPTPPNTTSSPRSKSSQSSPSKVGWGKAVFCLSFWNLVLAFMGTLMYIGQFTAECRAEPIAINILVWSVFQFSFACMSVAACCYLSYHAAAKAAEAADEGAGVLAVFGISA